MIKAHIINLAKNPDRLQHITSRMDQLGIAYERFEAVDGSKVSDEDYAEFQRLRPRMANKSWGRGQMGCFLSHYALWLKAAQSRDPFTAIFEDDVHLADSLPSFLQSSSWIPKGVDIIRLETSTNRLLLSKSTLSEHQGRKLHTVYSTSWCAGGYIISRECAQKLVSYPIAKHDTVDHFLFSFEHPSIAPELHLAQVTPALCVQDKMFYTNAQNIKFRSEIVENHEGNTIQARLKYLVRRSPFNHLKKTLQGYRRIHYAA